MLFYVISLGLVTLTIAQTKYCCFPDEFSAHEAQVGMGFREHHSHLIEVCIYAQCNVICTHIHLKFKLMIFTIVWSDPIVLLCTIKRDRLLDWSRWTSLATAGQVGKCIRGENITSLAWIICLAWVGSMIAWILFLTWVCWSLAFSV